MIIVYHNMGFKNDNKDKINSLPDLVHDDKKCINCNVFTHNGLCVEIYNKIN